jgi:hypothetical protein
MAGTYMMLIGADTRFKHQYVKWEAEVALEKGCRIIGVNLDGWRTMNKETCPLVIRGVGATFVPFSPQICAYALQYAGRHDSEDWVFSDHIYESNGYVLSGNCAARLPPQGRSEPYQQPGRCQRNQGRRVMAILA